jgi:hypothetical protein
MRRNIILIAGISALLLMLASCGADNYAKKAEKFYAIGEYFDAAEEYK